MHDPEVHEAHVAEFRSWSLLPSDCLVLAASCDVHGGMELIQIFDQMTATWLPTAIIVVVHTMLRNDNTQSSSINLVGVV
jgi:hypothetical protein